jgi:hypothetical protein
MIRLRGDTNSESKRFNVVRDFYEEELVEKKLKKGELERKEKYEEKKQNKAY